MKSQVPWWSENVSDRRQQHREEREKSQLLQQMLLASMPFSSSFFGFKVQRELLKKPFLFRCHRTKHHVRDVRKKTRVSTYWRAAFGKCVKSHPTACLQLLVIHLRWTSCFCRRLRQEIVDPARYDRVSKPASTLPMRRSTVSRRHKPTDCIRGFGT